MLEIYLIHMIHGIDISTCIYIHLIRLISLRLHKAVHNSCLKYQWLGNSKFWRRHYLSSSLTLVFLSVSCVRISCCSLLAFSSSELAFSMRANSTSTTSWRCRPDSVNIRQQLSLRFSHNQTHSYFIALASQTNPIVFCEHMKAS